MDAPRAGRRQTDPVISGPAGESRALAPVAPPRPSSDRASGFDAQLLGQDGVKRGLRGGAPVLEAARSAYLSAEWSGPADRRPPRGHQAKTKV